MKLKILFTLAFLLLLSLPIAAQDCSAANIGGVVSRFPFAPDGAAIGIDNLVAIARYDANLNYISTVYREPHLSQGNWSWENGSSGALPCGVYRLRWILAPHLLESGEYASGVKIGNLHNAYPEIFGGYTWQFIDSNNGEDITITPSTTNVSVSFFLQGT